MKSPISIIIPVYKNYALFYKYLRANKKYFGGCEVVVVNDYPEENITKPVKKIYPEARVFNNNKNLGFAGAVNRGITKSKRDYILLMNSDVVLKDDSFIKALDLFRKNVRLFAVGFSQLEKNGSIVGANRGYFKNGFVHHAGTKSNRVSDNFWAEGGASMFKKTLLKKLGLFDPLFNPFYWEDIDLSYRAWKAGYEIKFMPSVIVEHHHESTIGKYFDQSKIMKTAFRNQLLFHWKNLTDKDLLWQHLIRLPLHILKPGFLEALLALPQIVPARKKALKLFKKTDKKVLSKFK